MKLQVICIGNEILLGHTLNTNLAFIGACLQECGYVIEREVCIPDTAEAIAGALTEALAQADVVMTVGGLGPTLDDLTRPVVAETLGMPLKFDPEVMEAIERYLADRHVTVPCAAMERQAMVPEGAEAIPNAHGTAPGLWCPTSGKLVILFPGPPREMHPMLQTLVLPRLQARFPRHTVSRTIKTCGVPESTLAEQVEAFLTAYPQVAPAYCARPHMVDVRLTAAAQATGDLEAAAAGLVAALGRTVMSTTDESLPAAVGRLLREQNLTLATAESCTGGGIAAAITDVPGSSDYFCGAVVTYANEWKANLLGVRQETLDQHGAVSEETAAEMLDGLLKRYHVDAGIAVTGIAGPSGGTAEKPAGLVYIATGIGRRRQVEGRVLPGNRRAVRERTETLALNQLRLQLMER